MSITKKISNLIKEKHFGELLKESSAALVLRILGFGITYLFTIAVTRSSGADIWGIFSIFYTLSFLTSIITKMGVDLSLVKFTARYKADEKFYLIDQVLIKASVIVLPLLLILTALYYFFAPFIAEEIFGKVYLTSTVRYSAFTLIPLTYSSLFVSTLRGIKKIKLFALFQFVSQYGFALIFYGIIFSLTKDTTDANIPVLAFIIAVYVILILSYLTVRKIVKVDDALASDETITYKQILSSSLPLLLATSAVQLMVMVDTFFLGVYDSVVSTDEIGIYNVASRISRGTMMIPAAINAIAAPKLSEIYKQHDDSAYKYFVRRTSGLIFISTLPITLLLLLFPKFILGLFGPEFVDGVLILYILLLARQITSFSGSVSFVLQMMHKEKILQNIVLIALAANIILNLYLIPRIGATGAAVATASSLFIYILISIIYLKKKLGIEAYYFPRLKRKER